MKSVTYSEALSSAELLVLVIVFVFAFHHFQFAAGVYFHLRIANIFGIVLVGSQRVVLWT